MATLARRGIACPPCWLAGGAALVAGGAAWAAARAPRGGAGKRPSSEGLLGVAVGGAAVGLAVLTAGGMLNQHRFDAAARAAADGLAAERRDASDPRPWLIVYGDPQCHYCRQLKKQVLPAVRPRLASWRVEHRPAAEGMARPTLVLIAGSPRDGGPARQRRLTGLPSKQRLTAAIDALHPPHQPSPPSPTTP